MIAVDTSTWIAFLAGSAGDDVGLLDRALGDQQVALPPAVLTEMLSAPDLPGEVAELLASLPLLDVREGFWERAAALRRRVLARGRKARLGDALIAQSCLDHGVLLLTRDRDFRRFAEAAALGLLAPARLTAGRPP